MKDYVQIPSKTYDFPTVKDVITLADRTLWHIVCVQQFLQVSPHKNITHFRITVNCCTISGTPKVFWEIAIIIILPLVVVIVKT